MPHVIFRKKYVCVTPVLAEKYNPILDTRVYEILFDDGIVQEYIDNINLRISTCQLIAKGVRAFCWMVL